MATIEDFEADVAASTGTPQATSTPALAASPRGISFEDFAADVGAATGAPTQASPTTPLTNNAFSLAQEDARLKRKTRLADGVPVGGELDMPFLENLAAGANVTAEGEVATWRKFYGEKNVFVDSDGDIFIRQTTDKGLKQMIPVNEAGPSMADAARLVLALKDMYLSVRGSKMGQSAPTPGIATTVGGKFANMARQTAGGVAGSTVGQGGFALAGDDTLAGAVSGIGVNAAIEGVGGLWFGTSGQGARAVKDWWSRSTGKATKEIIGEFKERISGATTAEVIPREDVGRSLVDAISARGMQARAAREGVEGAVTQAVRTDVGEAMSRGTGTPAGMTRLDLGEGLTSRVVTARDEWKAADGAILDSVRADPRAQAFVLDPQGVVDKTRDMVRGMTSVQRTSPTGAGTTTETVPGLNVSGILDKLGSVISLEGGKVRLVDLMSARTAIGEAVAMGEAVPGTHTGAMKELYKNMTAAIEQGFVDLKSPDLQKKWKAATTHYAQAAEFFEQPAFKRVFKEGPQAVAPEEVVASLTDGNKAGDTYRTFKQLLRPAEMTQVKRAVADDLVGLHMDPTRTDIRAGDLSKRLKAFAQANPEMSSDVFGGELPEILATLDAAELATGKLATADLVNGIAGSAPVTNMAVRNMLAQRAVEARTFNNALVKQAVAGTLDPSTIKPSAFMSGLVDAKPSDLREVMRDITAPKTLREWRQATTTDLLETVLDPKTGSINQKKLLEEIGVSTSDRAQNLRMILGTDAEDVLRRMSEDVDFRAHMSKFMKNVLPSAVTAPLFTFKYRYLGAKVMGNILSDDTATRWLKHWRVNDTPPRLLEVHIGTLIREALDVPGQMTADEKASPQP